MQQTHEMTRLEDRTEREKNDERAFLPDSHSTLSYHVQFDMIRIPNAEWMHVPSRK